jgi:hypothetical protein
MSNGQVQIDPVLVERFANGNGTIFVGSGISSGSGMPLWGELIEPLRQDLGIDADSSANYLEIADFYETLYGRSELENYLRRMLGDVRFQLTRTHELIVGLPVQRIYTTNFDDLLEQASHKNGLNRTVISNASQVGLSDTSKLSIVKLHGDLNDPASLVFTASDYYSYFTKNPAVADLLKVELQTRTVLFLGYSFSDFDLGMILGKVALQSGATRPLLFSLQLRPTELATAALKRRGVKAIPIDATAGEPEASDKIEAWLRSFAQALHKYERRRHFFRKTDFRVGDNYGVPQHKRWPVRTKTLARIERGLRSEFPVVVVKGEPGIGKTQLVASAVTEALKSRSHLLTDEVYECVIWIRADSGENDSGHTLDRILRAISSSIQATAVPPPKHVSNDAGDDTRRELVKKHEINRLLQQEKVLVVIDDLERSNSSELVRIQEWLESRRDFANPKSKIIVTSRTLVLPGFAVEVGPLSRTEAQEVADEYAGAIKLRMPAEMLLGSGSIMLCRRIYGLGNPQAIKLLLGLMNLVLNPTETGGEQEEIRELKQEQKKKQEQGRKTGRYEEEEQKKNFNKQQENVETLINFLPKEELKEKFDNPCRRVGELIKELVRVIIENIKEQPAKNILTAMLAFPEAEPVPPYLLRVVAAGINQVGAKESAKFKDEFVRIAAVLVRCGLLDRDVIGDTYTMHRVTRNAVMEYITQQAARQRDTDGLANSTNPVDSARECLVRHLLQFLKDENVIRRPEIPDEYWNALVRDEMARVDPYWRIIKHAVCEVAKSGRTGPARQTDESEPIVQFAMLLTHYMDSRFLNDERHKILRWALEELEKGKGGDPPTEEERKQAALLRIDALAWTHIEEMMLDEASKEIDKGEKALPAKDKDLCALASCWRARIELARKNLDEAEKYLKKARLQWKYLNAWIRMRVDMIDGDLYLLKEQPRQALYCYRKAEALANTYGGEGNGYQTSPRIAISLVHRASAVEGELKKLDSDREKRARRQHKESPEEAEKRCKDEREEYEKKKDLEGERDAFLKEAEHRFERLIENERVSIGQLYGRYGKALIAIGRKSTREAMREFQSIWQEIYHRGGPGNQLLLLTEKLYEEIKLRGDYSF